MSIITLFKIKSIKIGSLITINNYYRRVSDKNLPKKPEEDPHLLLKLRELETIAPLYLFPEYSFRDDKELNEKSRVVLQLMQELILDVVNLKENEIEYLASNFGIYRVKSRLDLVNVLQHKCEESDEMVFNLGLRSISAILSWNIRSISIDKIRYFKSALSPIVPNFNQKERLFCVNFPY